MKRSVFTAVIPSMKEHDEAAALSELVAASSVPDKEKALAAVMARESEGSTAIGCGVAVPHARLDGLDGIEAVVGRSEEGIEMGGAAVRIFVLVLIPREAASMHVGFLASVMRVLSSETSRERILSADSADGILEVFVP